jgi:hypothetical protein
MKTFKKFYEDANIAKNNLDESLISASLRMAKKLPKFANKIKIGRMMKQSEKVFDQTRKGWRSLPTERQKEAVIRLFSQKNNINKTTKWHLGQVQAMRGKNTPAVTNMNVSKNPRDPQWNRYVNATTSFLEKNPEAFGRATNPKLKNYNQPTIDRLRQNFDKSYKDAY